MRMGKVRVFVFIGLTVGIVAVLIGRWIAGWGLVTVDVADVPLSRVIRTIERQGGITIRTNADPATPVTMLVERVSAYEAVDTLATAIDAALRLAYVAAPSESQIRDVLTAYSSGSNPGGWTVFSGEFGRWGSPPRGQDRPTARGAGDAGANRPRGPQGRRGGGFEGGGDWTPGSGTDPRLLTWKPSESEDKSLQALLDQGSQKTGALFAVPEDWNPVIGRLPQEGRTGKVAVSLVKNAQGSVREIFLLTVQPPRPQTAQGGEGGRREFTRTVFTPRRGGPTNPEWIAERAQAQIAALPVDQRAVAQKERDEMRAFWESVRNLPEAERLAKIEEMMNDPAVQEKMEERRNARDAKTPPQRREDRMRRYLDRKNQMKGNPKQS